MPRTSSTKVFRNNGGWVHAKNLHTAKFSIGLSYPEFSFAANGLPTGFRSGISHYVFSAVNNDIDNQSSYRDTRNT